MYTARTGVPRPPAAGAAGRGRGSRRFGAGEVARLGRSQISSLVTVDGSGRSKLQPDKVRREMIVSGGKLIVHFKAIEARFLRASFSAFVDLMVLVTKLVEEYGGVSQA